MPQIIPEVIVITGVTSGIGKALAESFASKGYLIAGCGRNTKILSDLSQTLGNHHLFYKCDISLHNQVKLFTLRYKNHFKNPYTKKLYPIRLIINSAAILQSKSLLNITSNEFINSCKINILGPLNIIQLFLPLIKLSNININNNNTMIILISTANFIFYEEKLGSYIPTKFGLEGLMRTIAPELPNNIGISCMWPGAIETNMLYKCYGKNETKSLNLMKPNIWCNSGIPNVINWLLLLNKKQHNGKTIGPPAEYLSLLKFTDAETAKKLSAGDGLKFDYIYSNL